MDVQLNEEHGLLQATLQRLLNDRYSFDLRRKIVADEAGYSLELWNAFAELGLLSAPFSEEFGGLGNSPITAMVVMQEFGRRLVIEPYFETVILAGGLIDRTGTPTQKIEHLSNIGSGATRWTLAWAERGARYDIHNVATHARRLGDEYIITGSKIAATAAPWADKLIVSARTSGWRTAADGISLFIVDRRSPNLHLRSFRTIDGRDAAELSLEGVKVPASDLLGADGSGGDALATCRDLAVGALCAEAVGIMSELNAATLEYAKARKQFGVAIGSFQALQHRMVDMFIAHQEALSLMQHLNVSLARKDPTVSRLASGAKSKIGYAARFVGEQSIQLHGGMGMSDELAIGHYFKRIAAIDIQFGDPAFHLARFSNLDRHDATVAI
ncbi:MULTISPECIES: acyl-CoA dehydrogenase family protein [unclassified Bradyrhizobium]|uniref:acyl-CoA dehydrogenase family protein n=1 Tax=unclassified Bradyrhizobium TaxID=2631580 RepID=UPI002305F75B|nr:MULTISPECIES: acyl-CoA dehydrogenase family protein [unclassified Bradyrhizobium]MDA9451189.1 acyl-CoA dehydrogenase [Bradyrhizobium sp. CCBAU 21360]MDA9457568.1 acyl-CoA dehydrogenase [Bradyrhizobium sp. CCBAU 21359]